MPTTTSAPISPGGVEQRRARAGRRRRTTSAPARVRARRSAAARSRTAPDGARVLQRARRSSRPRAGPSARSATTTSMPSGSARVRTTSMRLRKHVGVDDEAVARAFDGRARHSVIASAAAVRLVEQRRVGDRQAGEVGDHRLEVEQRLEPALARSPAGTACRRCTRPGSRARCAGSTGGVMRAVVAEADHRREHLVAAPRARAARPAPRSRAARSRQVESLPSGSRPARPRRASSSSEA